MSQINIQKLNDAQKKEKSIPDQPETNNNWSVWECAPSEFDWHYDQKEIAYVYEGKVKVKAGDEEVEIKSGDYVTFPAGLSCTWQVIEPIRKVYRFE